MIDLTPHIRPGDGFWWSQTSAEPTPLVHVDFVVTEHGAAALRGCSLGERARRMIAVAAPEHRERLEFDLEEYDLASATE